jgi:hypothetical protein
MKFALLKGSCLRWGYTIAALLLLFVAGFAVSLWVSAPPHQAMVSPVAHWPLGGWRALVYSLLLWCWPRLVGRLHRYHQHRGANAVSRRPLVILVVFYEGLMVQNPLAVLLSGRV